MEYSIPTTKDEMYETLKDVYQYYRINRESFMPTSITDLSLPRITFTPLTDTQLGTKAQVLVGAEQEKEKLTRKEKLNSEISKLNEQIADLSEQEDELVNKITEDYDNSENKVRLEATKRGFNDSNAVVNKIAELENLKNSAISAVRLNLSAKRTALTGEKTALTTELSNINTYYSALFTAMVNKKKVELSDDQEKFKISIDKYNNNQEEKENKQQISTALSNANLQVRFLELKQFDCTKEQLVNMGYYADVLAIVTGYYNTLSASSAYQDIATESKLMFYLDDFYEDTVYLYKMRAE